MRLMSTLAQSIVFALLSVGVLDAGQGRSTAPAAAQRVTFADGRVSFVTPRGFTALTPAEVAKHLPKADPQSRVLGDPERTTTVFYQLVDSEVSPAQLDAFRAYMAREFEKTYKNVKWVVNQVQRMGGREWARMEFTDTAQDMELHHIGLVTTFDGKRVVMILMNSTATVFPRVSPELQRTIASIAVKP